MTRASGAGSAGDPWVDPREVISIGVLMANGRLAPRTFDSLDEATAWAQDGEEVVQYNHGCACDR